MAKRILNGQSGASRVTPEMLAVMVEHLPTVGSLRDLAAITGARLDAVRRVVAPFLAAMKANGTHPQCGCGKDRFHPYGCVDGERKARYSTPIRGMSVEEALAAVAKRGPIIDAIMTGDPYSAIEQRLNLPQKSARKYLIHLTPEQLAQRKRMERGRAGPVGDKRPFGDALYVSAPATQFDYEKRHCRIVQTRETERGWFVGGLRAGQRGAFVANDGPYADPVKLAEKLVGRVVGILRTASLIERMERRGR